MNHFESCFLSYFLGKLRRFGLRKVIKEPTEKKAEYEVGQILSPWSCPGGTAEHAFLAWQRWTVCEWIPGLHSSWVGTGLDSMRLGVLIFM